MKCPICSNDCFRPSPNPWGLWVCNGCYMRFRLFTPGEKVPKTMLRLLEEHQTKLTVEGECK